MFLFNTELWNHILLKLNYLLFAQSNVDKVLIFEEWWDHFCLENICELKIANLMQPPKSEYFTSSSWDTYVHVKLGF